jgi:hypothetical protein
VLSPKLTSVSVDPLLAQQHTKSSRLNPSRELR